MSQEDIRVHIENALGLLQLITEDMEDNFITAAIDNAVKARATMTISALNVLDNYLRVVHSEVVAHFILKT